MKSIFLSQFYTTSKYKDKILSAIQLENNRELVQQLSSYLDEDILQEIEDKKIERTEQKKAEKEEQLAEQEETSEGEDEFEESEGDFSAHSSPSPAKFTPSTSTASEPAGEDFSESAQSEQSESTDETVTESVKIKASVNMTSKDFAKEFEIIKGELNSRDTTKGVNRLAVKDVKEDNELWIYYNDEINLNNIMGAVITHFEETRPKQLTFNRLARGDNAIVFIINEIDTGDITKAEKAKK